MRIDRTTQGIREYLFSEIERLEDAEVKTPDRMKLSLQIIDRILSSAKLDLAHKQFLAKAPEFAKNGQNLGMPLISGPAKSTEDGAKAD